MAKKSENERTAYTGIPLKAGEVLVPMLVDEDFIKIYQLSDDKIRTWFQAGVSFTVAFNAVPAESKELAMEQFNSAVNELLDRKLGSSRDSRCLIPQPDGSVKVCPKKRGDNRAACKDCPNRGIYKKEDKAIVSLEEMEDEYEFSPAAYDDTEKEAVFPIILNDLLTKLKDEDERIYEVLMRLSEGDDRKDIVIRLTEKYGIKTSRAYGVIKEAVNRLMEELNL